MSIEDREIPEMSVDELVDYVEDDIPTSEFTVEDTDRMVILGKLNAVLEWLKNHGYGTNIFSNGEYLEEYNIDLKLDKSVYDAFILALDDILEDIADALENIPTKTSDLINDSGFVDSSALALYQLLINASNPLSADLVNDSDTINKFVRAEDIAYWNGKQDAINDLSTIRSGASAGATAVQPSDLLNLTFPIGSIYLSVDDTSPASLVGGTWELFASGYTFWTTTTSGEGGDTIAAGLPNLTGSLDAFPPAANGMGAVSGVFKSTQNSPNYTYTGTSANTRAITRFNFDASNSNSIYGNSSTVQPPAIKVYAWKRTV